VARIQVVYDGHCGICRASMDRVEQMYGPHVQRVDFRIVPAQEIHPSLSEERCQAQMFVVIDGQAYGGAEALARLLRLHRVYRFVAWLYFVPPFGWLAERVYRLIARNRFRLSKWFGRGEQEVCTDACRLPDPKRK